MLEFLGFLYIGLIIFIIITIISNELDNIKKLWETDKVHLIILIICYLTFIIVAPFRIALEYFDNEYSFKKKFKNKIGKQKIWKKY